MRVVVNGYTWSMIFDIVQCAALGAAIFTLGLCGIVLGRNNVTIMLMSIEPMLLAVNLNLSVLSVYIDDIIGQSFASLVPTVAAAESAIGSAISVIYPRIRGTILVQFIHFIKG
jgi:NADH:ubiquinone oxidoreductase subunit K